METEGRIKSNDSLSAGTTRSSTDLEYRLTQSDEPPVLMELNKALDAVKELKNKLDFFFDRLGPILGHEENVRESQQKDGSKSSEISQMERRLQELQDEVYDMQTSLKIIDDNLRI